MKSTKKHAIGKSIATFRGSIMMFLNTGPTAMFPRAYSSVLKKPLQVLVLQGSIVVFVKSCYRSFQKKKKKKAKQKIKVKKGPIAVFHKRHYNLTQKTIWGTYSHGCQNRNLDHKISRFYDLTLPKSLKSQHDRKNGRIVCRIAQDHRIVSYGILSILPILPFGLIFFFLGGIHLGKIIHLNPQAQRVIRSPIMN